VDWPVDGVIAVDSADMLRRDEIPNHLPMVSIGVVVDPEIDHVQIDLSEGSSLAMAHLIDVGCEKVVHVRVATVAELSEEREFAYDQVLRDSGVDYTTLRVNRPSTEMIRRAVRDHVATEGSPDAFFCTNELGGPAALRGMADLGFYAPRDYKVIGFDAIDEGALMVPSITAVSKPVAFMCRQAVEFLLCRVRDPKIEVQSAILPTALVVRDSTTPQ
jgi:LacI family transcriptional regulator